MDMDEKEDRETKKSLHLLERLCQDFLCERFTPRDVMEAYVSNKETVAWVNSKTGQTGTRRVTSYDFKQAHLDRLVQIGALDYDRKSKTYEINPQSPEVICYFA